MQDTNSPEADGPIKFIKRGRKDMWWWLCGLRLDLFSGGICPLSFFFFAKPVSDALLRNTLVNMCRQPCVAAGLLGFQLNNLAHPSCKPLAGSVIDQS